MIARISGELISLDNTEAIVDCSGVGYLLNISLNTNQKLKDFLEKQVILFTQLIPKEDSLSLYGFYDTEEKEAFRLLITISGIGPKIALSILSSINYEELKELIIKENVFMLQKFPGIGKKTAERIILELKDKFTKSAVNKAFESSSNNEVINESIQAMISLGYTKQIAESAIKKAVESTKGEKIKSDVLIVKALSFARK